MMKTWIGFVIAQRKWVIGLCALVTIGLMSQLQHLAVVISSDNFLPQSNHYIGTGNEVESTFGFKNTAVVTITANQGTIYQAPILEKVKNITTRLLNTPGVIKTNVTSLSSRKVKGIEGTADGMTVSPLMERVPKNDAEMTTLKKGVASNKVYEDLLVSKDERTTQIVAEFRENPKGMTPIEESVRAAVAPEVDSTVDIAVGGPTILLAWLEKFSARMAFLLPLALLIVALIHYEAFRTLQAMILPLVTALLAVIWSVSLLALSGRPMDVFNATTPILILAVAAGHAVQILKRYYEEYSTLRRGSPTGNPKELSRQAVLNAMTKVGPVMVVACTVAALGFFSLIVFEIKAVRTFGIMTGLGIVSALVLELTFIPALRSMLPAPGERESRREKQATIWDRLIGGIFAWVSNSRRGVYALAGIAIVTLSLGGYRLKIDNSVKGAFYGHILVRDDDDKINTRMAGANTFSVLVDGTSDDSIKDPRILAAMDKVQAHLAQDPRVGKTVSLVDFIKRMNQAMNADQKDFYKVPTSRELVAQYLLLYSSSGEPQDFDSYVDNGYRKAHIQVLLKTDSTAALETIVADTLSFAKGVFPPGTRVEIGGGNVQALALNEEMIRSKLLNILQILGCVFLISAVVFRSILAGLLILVPLVATVFVNFGIMGLFGIPLNIPTSLTSAMAIGIGADYAIYLSFRMREELELHHTEGDALRIAFLSAGKAAVFVSTAVAGGFGVLMLSWGFNIHFWMGVLLPLAMVVSSMATLTVFASLILSLRPRYIFGAAKLSLSPVQSAGMVVLALVLLPGSAHAAPTPDEIMRANFLTLKVNDSTANATFRLITPLGQERVRDTDGMTKLIAGTTDNMRFVNFKSPADVRGTKTLLIEHTGKDDDIWIYLPAMHKVRRLVSSNKKDSFVGTDFSYGDVIGHRPEDWNHKLLREEKVDGKDCYVIESTPKRAEVGDNTGYSKRLSWVDKVSSVAARGELYDLNGELIKKTSAEDIQKVDSKNEKYQPMKVTAENVQTGHKTVIEFKNFAANVGVGDEVFTTRSLEK